MGLCLLSSCVLEGRCFLPGWMELIGHELWRGTSANAADWCVWFERQPPAESFLKLISHSLFYPLTLSHSCAFPSLHIFLSAPPPLIFISHRGWRNSSTGSLLAMWLQNHGRTSANKRRLSDASTSSHSCNRILNSEWEECVSVCIYGGVSVCNETRGRSPEGLECVTSSQHFLDVMDASTDVRALTCPR